MPPRKVNKKPIKLALKHKLMSVDDIIFKYRLHIKNPNILNAPEKIKQGFLFNFYKENPVAFIDDCCILSETGGDSLIELEDPQKKVIDTFYNKHFIIFKKSRQIGITTVFRCICSHLMVFHDNISIGVVSKSQPEASKFCRQTKTMITKIPYDWLRPENFVEDNVRTFSLENGSRIVTAAVSLAAPDNTLRGESLTVLIMDEAAFINKVDDAWTSISPALGMEQKTARQNDVPYGTALISTPNKKTGKGEFYYREWVRASNGESDFVPMVIHWSEMKRCTREWYDHQCKELGNPKKIAQELDLKFVGDDDSIWPEEIQTKLNEISDDYTNHNLKGKVPLTTYLKNSFMEVYVDNIDQESFYFIGVDIAGAAGSDYSAIQVIDFYTDEQVAEYRAKIEPIKFSGVVKEVARLFPHNIIIVENTSGYADTVLSQLIYDKEQTYNIYGEYRETGENMAKKVRFVEGLSNNRGSRKLIMESMYNQVVDNTNKIKSKKLALELLSLVEKRDKILADTGLHDDLVLAYAFPFYVKNYDKQFYKEMIREHGEQFRKNIGDDVEKKPRGFERMDNVVFNFITDINSQSTQSEEMEKLPDDMKISNDEYIEKLSKKNRKTLMEKTICEVGLKENKKSFNEDDEDEDVFVYDIFSKLM